jgi:segregation and condensation protein A
MSDATIQKNSSDNIDKLDGIEILVDWAKSGKIDPWDLDIVKVTDMFLEKLLEIKQLNLRLTGRTLFFAAVLLKLKSNFLEGLDPFKQEEDLLEEPDNMDFDVDYDETEDPEINIRRANVVSLENAISRRTSVRQSRTRKVTLEELIKQLRKLEEIENKHKRKVTEERIKERRSYTHFTPDDILEMAHDEYIEDEIIKLQDILSRLFETGQRVEFNELVNAGMDKVSAYIALLFLASREHIELVQDDFYSDLYVIKEVS